MPFVGGTGGGAGQLWVNSTTTGGTGIASYWSSDQTSTATGGWGVINVATNTIYYQAVARFYNLQAEQAHREFLMQQQQQGFNAANSYFAQAAVSSDKANRRARALFMSHLTPPQRREFAAHKFVTFRSASGRRMRIHQGHIGNVDQLHDGDERIVARLCAHPDRDLPTFDHMVAQLLHLRDAELERNFFAIANRHPVIQRAA